MPSKKVKEQDDETDNLYQVSNLYSEQELKTVTQDFLSEKIRKLKYEENVKYSNIRIFLCLVLIFIGTYCTIFVSYKKEPSLMIQLIGAFFATTIALFIFEYFYFENSFIILRASDNTEIKIVSLLNNEKNFIKLTAKSNKTEVSTELDLPKLFNERGYLIRNYAEAKLKEFLVICEKKFDIKRKA